MWNNKLEPFLLFTAGIVGAVKIVKEKEGQRDHVICFLIVVIILGGIMILREHDNE
jgi:hypothetical protein